MSMEIKRCLLTKTTNDSTFAIYPKSSADLIDVTETVNGESITYPLQTLLDKLKSYGTMHNNTFCDSKMYPKAINGGSATTEEEIAAVGGGFWDQVKGANKGTTETVINHQRRMVETKEKEKVVSPTIRLQNYVTYNSGIASQTTEDGKTVYTPSQQFCRVTSAYHETIADGKVDTTSDFNTPNFTPLASFAHNRFRGNGGMCAIIGRIQDVYYTNEELKNENGKQLGSSKSCAAAFYANRLSNYDQGKYKASYSIALETQTLNNAQEDGLLGKNGYYGNNDYFDYKTWACGYHLIGGGRRPITTGILIRGKTASCEVYPTGETDSNGNPIYSDVKDVNGDNLYSGDKPANTKTEKISNGMYNAIFIGESAMAIKGENSPHTVGINMAGWTKSKHYGYSAIRIGYAPRFLTGRGPAYFEAPSFKFLNSKGDMPIGITAKENKSPYILYKTGATAEERPVDTIRAKTAYYCNTNKPADNYFTISSDNDIRFATKCLFYQTNTVSDDDDDNISVEERYNTNAAVYKFKNNKFFGTLINIEKLSNQYGSEYNQELRNRSYPVLGTEEYPWQTAYLKESPWVFADEKIFDNYDHDNDGTPDKLSENSIKKWGNIPMDECVYYRNDTEDQHNTAPGNRNIIFALTEQKIAETGFDAGKGYLKRVYDIGGKSNQFEEDTTLPYDKNSIYAIDYNQCFVIEGAYNRYKHKKHDDAINANTTDINNIKSQIYENGTPGQSTIIQMINSLNQRYQELYNMVEALSDVNQNDTIASRLTNIETNINSIESDIDTLTNGLETTNTLIAQYHPNND